jgi:hypothetical protein
LSPDGPRRRTDGKPMDARELMLKSIGGYPMATKASGTLALIIEKQHTPWGLMVTALPALELHFRCQLRIASARTILGPSGPCARVVVRVYVELANGLQLACIPSSGLLSAEACLAAAGHTCCGFGCRLASYGAPTALGACIEHCHGCVSGGLRGVKMGPSAYAIHTVPSHGCVLQGLRPRWP